MILIHHPGEGRPVFFPCSPRSGFAAAFFQRAQRDGQQQDGGEGPSAQQHLLFLLLPACTFPKRCFNWHKGERGGRGGKKKWRFSARLAPHFHVSRVNFFPSLLFPVRHSFSPSAFDSATSLFLIVFFFFFLLLPYPLLPARLFSCPLLPLKRIKVEEDLHQIIRNYWNNRSVEAEKL